MIILPSKFDDDAMRNLRGPGVLSFFGNTRVACCVDRGFGEEWLEFESGGHPVAVPDGARVRRAVAETKGFFVVLGSCGGSPRCQRAAAAASCGLRLHRSLTLLSSALTPFPL